MSCSIPVFNQRTNGKRGTEENLTQLVTVTTVAILPFQLQQSDGQSETGASY